MAKGHEKRLKNNLAWRWARERPKDGRVFPARLPTRLALLLGAAVASARAAAPVDFRRDVLPILSDACFRCHGPDEGSREGHDLRLDTKEGLFRTRKDVTVVKPGDVDASELVVRTSSTDEDEMMPPPKAQRKLKPEEIATLRRWVAEGAPWSVHWSFVPISAAEPPKATSTGAIDAFVRAKLAAEKLSPAPEADRERLLRRVTLDLTGLPPTPAEADAFLADQKSDAYERVVDRLLASPRYGERMATDWLDVARFADTHGYQMDRPRAMWAWRDWVIKAFNENLPFDRFATWQLAGDLLPNATKEQRLATAFNRLHNQNEEGGIVDEEYRQAYVADRVDTFGTAFLGLTFECTRCHDHKFDPLTQRDFYSLASFFQNIDESGQITYLGFHDAMPVPTLLLTTDEQDKMLAELRRQAADGERALAQAQTDARGAFEKWLAAPKPAWFVASAVAAYDLDGAANGKVENRIVGGAAGKVVETPRFVAGPHGKPVAELDGESGFTFAGVGTFKRTDPFSLAIAVQPPAEPAARAVVVHKSKAPADAGSRGYELLLENGRVAFGIHYMWPGASIKVVTKQALPAGAWTRIVATYDGSSRAAGAKVYLDGVPAELEVVRDGLFKDIVYAPKSEPDLTIGFRFRDNGFKGGRVAEFRVYDFELTAFEVAQGDEMIDLNGTSPTPKQREQLFEYYVARWHEPTKAAAAALREARERQNAFIAPIPEAMVMQELPQPKQAFILKRGAYDQLGAEVHADTPGALPAFPKEAPRNRLGLAQWLTSPANPLLARVTVNRLWQQMFGRGLVETSDNFGAQGSPPTHPALLDWLARDFMTHGWDVKRALKQIALSATYRQSSRGTPELLARDPQNLLLARGPARRLTAEMLRDQALVAGGLLAEKIGGPSVKPYQPPGLWEEIAMGKPKYEMSHGDDLHRRSLYTFWKRTVPPPAMVIFDAAERNVCTVRRQSTSTPLQALALLNDVQVVEAARFIGQRMLREGGAGSDAQLTWAFRLVTGRHPEERELSILRQMHDEQLAYFRAEPAAAEKFNAFGEAKTDEQLPAVERAAAGVVAQALLNFDEALMSR